ncbi:hypothetical protein A1O3_06836 [Capronia epimyces CBS 606.96]|uniref:Uncharacterized protein n=1 Tax=Capronia epimyces CBS 606.96 TaxID=1182542 RepID=W9YL74_9EURO|nr:uncharacterized protein A1O3_06836 [Capronia epimyces CBS 606.96]EXJ83019.1 hypothetical protein A1O3_06836 [Capronia epimyces CBS 606.96]
MAFLRLIPDERGPLLVVCANTETCTQAQDVGPQSKPKSPATNLTSDKSGCKFLELTPAPRCQSKQPNQHSQELNRE